MVLAALMAVNASAQTTERQWTLNTNAWSTNYFTSSLYGFATFLVKNLIFDEDEIDSLTAERIIPMPNMVFPVGMGKSGFDYPLDIYGPYHRAFANPFTHIGDWGVGLDASFKPSVIGFYAGAYFKSKEIVFANDPLNLADKNMRAFYLQPRAGLIVGGKKKALEAGVHYDIVTGCGGSVDNVEKDMFKSGLGLDFALSYTSSRGNNKTLLSFSMPLHNFLNTDYTDKAGNKSLAGMKRKVGYIMLTRRIML